MGKTFVIEEWVAEMDAATCNRCRAMHGKEFKQGTGPEPPLHPNCRCKRVYVRTEERGGGNE